jgi:hypothetical protein
MIKGFKAKAQPWTDSNGMGHEAPKGLNLERAFYGGVWHKPMADFMSYYGIKDKAVAYKIVDVVAGHGLIVKAIGKPAIYLPGEYTAQATGSAVEFQNLLSTK